MLLFGAEKSGTNRRQTVQYHTSRTLDGIQIDDNMHAIDHDFKAIPGLYVIGDMSGNYFSGSYPSLMAGAAAGRSATFGRLAGQNAAAGI